MGMAYGNSFAFFCLYISEENIKPQEISFVLSLTFAPYRS